MSTTRPPRTRRNAEEAAQLRAEIVSLATAGMNASDIAARINDALPPGDPFRITAGSVRRELGKMRRGDPAAVPPRPPPPPPVAPTPPPRPPPLVTHPFDPAAAGRSPADGRTAGEVVALAALYAADPDADEDARFAVYVEHLAAAGPDTAAAAAGADRADLARWHSDPVRMRRIRQVQVQASVDLQHRLRQAAAGLPSSEVDRRLWRIAMGEPMPQAVGDKVVEVIPALKEQLRALDIIQRRTERAQALVSEREMRRVELYLSMLRDRLTADGDALPAERMVAGSPAPVFEHMGDVDLMTAGGGE